MREGLCQFLVPFTFSRASVVLPVYNYVSSPANMTPWRTYDKFAEIVKDVFSIQQSIWYYFSIMTESYILYEIGHFFLHKIPGVVLDKVAVWNGQKAR